MQASTKQGTGKRKAKAAPRGDARTVEMRSVAKLLRMRELRVLRDDERSPAPPPGRRLEHTSLRHTQERGVPMRVRAGVTTAVCASVHGYSIQMACSHAASSQLQLGSACQHRSTALGRSSSHISQPQARGSRGANAVGHRSPAHLRGHIRALEPGRDVLHRRDGGKERINSLETRRMSWRTLSSKKSRIVLGQRAQAHLSFTDD